MFINLPIFQTQKKKIELTNFHFNLRFIIDKNVLIVSLEKKYNSYKL